MMVATQSGRWRNTSCMIHLYIIIQTLGLRFQVEPKKREHYSGFLGSPNGDPVVQIVGVVGGEGGGCDETLRAGK